MAGSKTQQPCEEMPMRKSLAETLAAVEQWREEQLVAHGGALANLDEELATLRARLAELEHEIREVTERRRSLDDAPRTLAHKSRAERHRAVIEFLASDQELLQIRAADLAQARAQQRQKLEHSLNSDPELAEMVQEYERFCEVEAQLEALPDSYRKAILQHHDVVRRRLEPLMRAAEGADATLSDSTQSVTIVVSADPADGEPSALVMLVPVDIELHTRWRERSEDLCSELTYRLYAAACSIARTVGVPDAPISCRPFEGHLAIQVWFGSGSVTGSVEEVVEAEIAKIREEARELQSSNLELALAWVDPELLAAPDEETTPEATAQVAGRVKVVVGQRVEWTDQPAAEDEEDPDGTIPLTDEGGDS